MIQNEDEVVDPSLTDAYHNDSLFFVMTLQLSEDTTHAQSFFVAPGIDALQRADDIRIQQFGPDSRLATLPEIIAVRIVSPLDAPAWRLPYITTSTVVYMGNVRGSTPRVVVAHGVGPMATLEGAQEFIHAYPDIAFERQRIFNRLVQGEYGSVSVFDVSDVAALLGHLPGLLTHDDVLENPFILSMLGKKDCVENYLRILAGSDTIQAVSFGLRHVMPSRVGFEQFNIFEQIEFGPCGFFIRIDGISRHTCDTQCTSYCSKVTLHYPQQALRFVAIQGTEPITSIRLSSGDLCL